MWVHRPPHNRRSRIAVMQFKKMCCKVSRLEVVSLNLKDIIDRRL